MALAHIEDGADLHGAVTGARDLGGIRHRLIDVLAFEDVVAAELFLR